MNPKVLHSQDIEFLKMKVLRLMKFSATHDRLTYQIVSEGEEETTFITFTGCRSISTPTHHRAASPIIENLEDGMHRFSDEKAVCIEFEDLLLHCAGE